MPEIVQLLVSPVHRYAGRPGELAEQPPDETVEAIRIRAGLGIVGDRYFNVRAHREAAITIMSVEALAPYPGAGLSQTRRNVLLRGVDVDAGRGRVLTLDSGDGPVRLRVHRAANPCRWMDYTLAPGAWKDLRGHGGMRCEPLSDGVLRVGPVFVEWSD